jgi:predicted dehydrogenase
VQTVGLGPHRLNRALRPDWFFQRDHYGGVLCDIGCHQVEQFLTFTGSTDAEIAAASVGNFANPGDPGLEDFGEMLLRSDSGRGYVRVDWYTPDGLATWGDGRLTVLGTDGYLELRKNIDIAGRPGTDHLFLVDNKSTRTIDCNDAGLPYYPNLVADVLDRTETAMPQSHCFKVMELALRAEAMATRLGALRPLKAER